MNLRRYNQVRSPLGFPIGHAIAFPLVDHPSGRVIGYIAQILFEVETSASAFTNPTGQIDQTLFPLRQSGEGQVLATGSIVQTLKKIIESAEGVAANPVTGTASQTLHRLTQNISGQTNHAEIAMVLQRIRQAVVGAMENQGTVNQRLSALSQHLVGTVPIVGDGDQILRLIQQHATGLIPNLGTIDQTLGTIIQHVTAKSVNVDGEISQLLFEITQLLNGTHEIVHTGHISMRIGTPLVFSLTGEISPAGRIGQTLFGLTQASDGMVHPTGHIAQRLEAIVSTAIGARTASIDQRLFGISMSFVAGMEAFGTSTTKLTNRLTQSAHGVVSAQGQVAQSLHKLTQSGTMVIAQTYGTAAQTLSKIQQHGSGLTTFGIVGNQTLKRITTHAIAVELFPGTIGQTLSGIRQEAQVAISASWGEISQVLPALIQAAEGYSPAQGSIAQTLQRLVPSATGWIEIKGPVTTSLRGVSQVAHGTEKMFGTVSSLLRPVFMTGEGSALNYGHIVSSLSGLSQDGAGWAGIVGAIDLRLHRMIMDGGGLAPSVGTIGQVLTKVSQSATGAVRPHVRATAEQTLFGLVQDVRGYRAIDGQVDQLLSGLSVSAFGSVGTGVSVIDEEKMIPNGRLTLVAGAPWVSTTVSGATTIYYSPAIGNTMYDWSGGTWISGTFAEISQALSDTTYSPAAAAASNTYDLFVWKNSEIYILSRGPAWLSKTNRGTGTGTAEIAMQSGFFVNANDITNGPAAGYGLYVGTISTNSTAAAIDWNVSMDYNAMNQRSSVFNAFNQRQIVMNVYDGPEVDRDPISAFKILDVQAMDSSGTIIDASVVGATVTSHGSVATTLDPAASGKLVIDLRTSGAYLSVPYNSGFAPDIATAFLSWECWFYPTATPSGYGGLMACAASNSGIALNTYQNAPRANTRASSYPEITTPAKLTTGSWHHVVMNCGNGMVAIYVDDQLVGSGALANGTTASNLMLIGRTFDGYQNAGYYAGIRAYRGAIRTPAMFRGF